MLEAHGSYFRTTRESLPDKVKLKHHLKAEEFARRVKNTHFWSSMCKGPQMEGTSLVLGTEGYKGEGDGTE